MLDDFNCYATNAMEENDVYRAFNENRPNDCGDETANWYKNERCHNLEPADKGALFPVKKRKRAGTAGFPAGRPQRIQTEGVK